MLCVHWKKEQTLLIIEEWKNYEVGDYFCKLFLSRNHLFRIYLKESQTGDSIILCSKLVLSKFGKHIKIPLVSTGHLTLFQEQPSRQAWLLRIKGCILSVFLSKENCIAAVAAYKHSVANQSSCWKLHLKPVPEYPVCSNFVWTKRELRWKEGCTNCMYSR